MGESNRLAMVCKDCEKFQTSVICPEPWKAGSNNSFAGQTGRKLGENKLLSRNAKISRGNTLINKCKLCKQRVNDTHGTYCQGCAFSKGICHICGVLTLQGAEFYRSNYSEEMQEKFAPKRDAAQALPDAEIAASDAALKASVKKEKREKKKRKKDELHSNAEEATAAADVAAVQVPDGFVLDAASGYYHNSATGQYYEPNSKLYCCFTNEQWYYYDTTSGEYKPWVQQTSADAVAPAEEEATAVAAPVEQEAPAEEEAVVSELLGATMCVVSEMLGASVPESSQPAEAVVDESTTGFTVCAFGDF